MSKHTPRTSVRMLLLAAALTALGACGDSPTTVPAASAPEAGKPRLSTSGFAASTVAGGPYNLRSGPGTSYGVVGTIGGNVAVTIMCQEYGTTVTGAWGPTNVWDRLSNGAWITDGFVYTGSNGLVAPLCSSLPPTTPTAIAPGARGNDYPYVNDPAVFDRYGCSADPWAFCKRNCTSFVAWRLRQVNNVPFSNTYRTTTADRWGNASNWGLLAQRLGIPMDRNPRVGDVAWFSSGHVAWVAAVNSDGTVLIEEYNYDWRGNYGTRTIPASNVSGFIHIT